MRTVLVIAFMLVMSLTTLHAFEIHVRERIAPTFDFLHVYEFYNGRAAVTQETPYGIQIGIIDTYGDFVIPFRYFDPLRGFFFDRFSEGFIALLCEETWLIGFYDIYGNLAIEYQFANAMPFSYGLAAVQMPDEELWGFIDTTGQFVVPPAFDWVRSFSNGLAAVAVWQYEWQNIESFMETSDGLMAIDPRLLQHGWGFCRHYRSHGGLSKLCTGVGFCRWFCYRYSFGMGHGRAADLWHYRQSWQLYCVVRNAFWWHVSHYFRGACNN